MTTSNTTLRIFFFSVVSALAGFLFGFDTVVISGAERIRVNPYSSSLLSWRAALTSPQESPVCWGHLPRDEEAVA